MTHNILENKCFWLILLILALLAVTLPRAVMNYGIDGDAFRGMIAAKTLAQTGSYEPSRLPGNPLFEYLLAAASLLNGHLISNTMVLLFYPACLFAFAAVIEGFEKKWLLFALFALTPILVVNAATTMDYIPGLAMVLWSYRYAGKGKELWAFLFLGLAIGFRLSNALFVVPFGLFLILQGVPLMRVIPSGILGIALGLLFYIPILAQCGWKTFEVPSHAYGIGLHVFLAGYRSLMVFGPIASAGIIVLLLLNTRRIIGATRRLISSRDPSYIAELSTVFMFLLIFLRHPDQSEYLIPVIPFAYLLAWRWFGPRQLLMLFVLVVSFSFVSIEFKGGESGRRTVTFRPDWGILVRDFFERKELNALRDGLPLFRGSDKAVILHGYGPMLGFENAALVKVDANKISSRLDSHGISETAFIHQLPGREVYFISGISRENVDILRDDGYEIYCFSDSAPSHAIRKYGYDPYRIGIKRLDVLTGEAFYK
ncbi:hypothetical protein ACFL2Q_05430 [Thermodesulfobacteriota bacterium]